MNRRRRLFESGRRDRINAIRGSIEMQASIAKSARDALLKKQEVLIKQRDALADELVRYETSEIEKLAPRAVELLKDYIDVWSLKQSKLKDYFESESGNGAALDVPGDGHFFIRASHNYEIYFDFQGDGEVSVFERKSGTPVKSLESWLNDVVWEDIDPNTEWEASEEEDGEPILIKVDADGAKKETMEYVAFIKENFDAFAAEVESAIDQELDRLEGTFGK